MRGDHAHNKMKMLREKHYGSETIGRLRLRHHLLRVQR
jgi:hypothetical protein